jgi:DNA polymerase-3 subunit epsilon
MSPPAEPLGQPPRKSLRQRIVVTFGSLAIIPFVVVLACLFVMARHDVGVLSGEDLVREAGLLVAQLEAQVAAAERAAAGVAALPGVREHLAGTGLYPQEALSLARRVVPGLKTLLLVREAAVASAGPVSQATVRLGADEGLEIRIGVTDLAGRRVGALAAVFDLDQVRRVLEWYRKGEEGRALLYNASGMVLAGPADLPVPPLGSAGGDGETYEARGVAYLFGSVPVNPGRSGLTAGWRVAVIQPAEELYGPFYSASRQVAFVLAAFSLVILALAWRMADQFLRPILRIRSGAEIVSRINLAHRIHVETGDELQELADEFNHMAESLAGAYDELEARVQETTRSLQEERNRLAAVLRTMAEGVVVTNEAGEVLLMNPAARVALNGGPSAGIGAPLARLLPAQRLDFHLKRLRSRWEEGRETVERVVFPLVEGPVLRGLISAILGPDGGRAGFLVVLRDTGSRVEDERRLERTLREMPELLRGPAAAASSLLETLARHPEMPVEKQRAFLSGVREEVGRLTDRLRSAEEAAAAAETLLPGFPSDPGELLREAAASVPGAFVRIEVPAEPLPPVAVEPFSWVASLACALRWVAGHSSGWSPVVVSLRLEDDTVVTSFRVEGQPAGSPAELDAQTVSAEGEGPITLGEVVRRNRGELWMRDSEGGFEVRLALVRATGTALQTGPEGIVDDQPEFYDFDLFLPRPSREGENLLHTPLSALEYVVFDTETTGLQPSRGDEIVSLSAIRVRQGRMQGADTFHTLVNPGRPIPQESIRFHGIEDSMVADAPTIVDILPRFYEYVGTAVLVAHNAAFDKKFLDLAAARANMPQLDNPILDTLFLSYGIHRDFEGHNLDAIAERLGIQVEGRHTSLGDARATAAVLLRLIQLLAPRGIATLAEAKSFCDRMLLLRWQSSRF